jgi:hypothetical protein
MRLIGVFVGGLAPPRIVVASRYESVSWSRFASSPSSSSQVSNSHLNRRYGDEIDGFQAIGVSTGA